MTELERIFAHLRAGKSINVDEQVGWHCAIRIDKYDGVDLALPEHAVRFARGYYGAPDDYWEGEKNLLMTVGATDLLNGLVTAGLATPWNSTNAGIGVGDSNTAASAGQTDLQAAAGSTITTSGLSNATNASPIVLTNGSGNWTVTPTVGSVVVVASVNGNTAANATWEVSAATSTTISLLNSTGNGAFSASGSATVKAINRYLQILSGAPSVSSNQVQFTCTVGANNANHAWAEMATVLGQASTNKQAAAPTKQLNRFVSSMGTKAQGASWVPTETITLS